MLILKNLVSAAALLLLLNACGTSSEETPRQQSQTPRTETAVETPTTGVPVAGQESADAQASYVRVDAADGQSAFACSYSINGKTVEGKSQEECERLKKDFEKAAGAVAVPSAPAAGQSQVACAFNINGKLYEGKSQLECDKLKKDLGITLNIPSTPAPAPTQPQASTNVVCQFNINGKSYQGTSQAECDKLKKDLGLQF